MIRSHDEILSNAYKHDIICYTDGSVKYGKGGAGAVIAHSNPIQIERIGACLFGVTPLLAELAAIEICLLKLMEFSIDEASYVHVFCDCSCALNCLNILIKNNDFYHSIEDQNLPLVDALRIKDIYLKASSKMTLRFHWIKSHSGILGNEQADTIAKYYRNQIF